MYTFVFSASSLILHLSQNVQVGNQVDFNCTSSGASADPTFTWSIKDYNGITVSPSLTALYPVPDSNPNDGVALSQVKFVVTAEHLDPNSPKRLWCAAIDQGKSVPTIQIYTVLTESVVTTCKYMIKIFICQFYRPLLHLIFF